MVVILKSGTKENEIERLTKELENLNVTVDKSQGTGCTILGLVGDTSKIDPWRIELEDCVQKVMKVQEPFKKANRAFHPENTVIDVCGRKIGGAFKPRTSPYSFQGLKYEGLDLLHKAKEETGLPVVTEIMSPCDIPKFIEKADIIQVGARNMQNFDLLKELGKIDKPILLKRGLSATMEELLMSAEYIMAGGNENVILCERGIRTFETYTRNTLDLSMVPAIKKMSHLPVVVDPSHATGKWWMVESLSKAAVAVGADGLIIEVHNDPKNALCDGAQSIKPEVFAKLMEELKVIAKAVGREI